MYDTSPEILPYKNTCEYIESIINNYGEERKVDMSNLRGFTRGFLAARGISNLPKFFVESVSCEKMNMDKHNHIFKALKDLFNF